MICKHDNLLYNLVITYEKGISERYFAAAANPKIPSVIYSIID